MSAEVVIQLPISRYNELIEREKILLIEENYLEVKVHVGKNVEDKDRYTSYKGDEVVIHMMQELKKLGQDKFCLTNTLEHRDKEIRKLMLDKQRLNRELENTKSSWWYRIGYFLTRGE